MYASAAPPAFDASNADDTARRAPSSHTPASFPSMPAHGGAARAVDPSVPAATAAPTTITATPATSARRRVAAGSRRSSPSSASIDGHRSSGRGESPRARICRSRRGTLVPSGGGRSLPLATLVR